MIELRTHTDLIDEALTTLAAIISRVNAERTLDRTQVGPSLPVEH